MKGHGQKFGRKQEAAIAALISCATVSEAAKQAGVSGSTLMRWMNNDDFCAAYRRARAGLVEEASNALRLRAVGAVKVLWNVATSPKSKSTARVSACRAIIEFVFKGVEQEQLREIHGLIEEVSRKLEAKKR